MTVEHGTKVPANYWGGEGSGEGELVVRRDYVCAGVLDKNVFGKFGLVHAIKGSRRRLAGDFISACSRLLTAFLQKYGMTCGMDDLLLRPEAEAGRCDQLAKSEKACRGAAATFAEADENAPDVALREQIAARACAARGRGGDAGHALERRAEQGDVRRRRAVPPPRDEETVPEELPLAHDPIRRQGVDGELLADRRVPRAAGARGAARAAHDQREDPPVLPPARRRPEGGRVRPGPVLLEPPAAGVLLPLHGRARGSPWTPR